MRGTTWSLGIRAASSPRAGILNLDSPAFEGQDVKGIINWLTDNAAYTFPAFDNDVLTDANTADPAYGNEDPAIGMVGGSYGGAIQLVTAGIDPRVDVIVPGIAWNSLEDALYPNQTFKTSWSGLLLLGLVTTGARINPQIYGGIFTRRAAGHPHAGSDALLPSSGPDFLDGQHHHPDAVHPGHPPMGCSRCSSH